MDDTSLQMQFSIVTNQTDLSSFYSAVPVGLQDVGIFCLYSFKHLWMFVDVWIMPQILTF